MAAAVRWLIVIALVGCGGNRPAEAPTELAPPPPGFGRPDNDLTVPQAAALLGISDRDLRRKLDQGLIPHTRFGPRGRRRVKRSDVERLRDSVTYCGSHRPEPLEPAEF